MSHTEAVTFLEKHARYYEHQPKERQYGVVYPCGASRMTFAASPVELRDKIMAIARKLSRQKKP